MMLEQYRELYINKNAQFIFVDQKGIVQESDQVLFDVKSGSSIFELHPFFESLGAIFEGPEEEIDLNCVHLSLQEGLFIIDIKILKKQGGLLLIIHDFTQHYNSYRLVTQARNESVIKTELTVIKNLELEERERFKNRFIQNFSHELRNPLTSIMAITDLLQDTKLDVEQSQMMRFLKDSNSNLKLLLEDILSMSMIDSGRLTIIPKMFDLVDFLEHLKFTYQAKAKEKGLSFIASWDGDIPNTLEGDRLRLFQVLTNLLDNALKYTETGTVTLNVKLNQKRANRVSLRFQVKDTGIGISPEDFHVIFESFKQLHSNNQSAGNGLGLAIAEGLLNLMDSKIKIKSKIDQGSEFYFDLGLKYQLLTSVKTKVADPKISVGKLEISDGPKLRLLLVEDDLQVQTTLFKSLLSTGRFHIDLVYDGALVLQEVVSTNYDIIIMDVHLPSISGDQIAKLIREFPFKNIKDIPIIGITADGYPENIKKCLHAGMNKVLIKPFDKEVFLDTIFKTVGHFKG